MKLKQPMAQEMIDSLCDADKHIRQEFVTVEFVQALLRIAEGKE